MSRSRSPRPRRSRPLPLISANTLTSSLRPSRRSATLKPRRLLSSSRPAGCRECEDQPQQRPRWFTPRSTRTARV
ncbi:hypothetical protein EVA_14335 [gut metagenome]|uniref:Uncharacterized protein n=1 Tax=gut metagenome TaxID=749906 RepID=J9FSV2_9ZZZZ